MKIFVAPGAAELGKSAAQLTGTLIRKAISEKGNANIILATGESQFETLYHLTNEPNLDWSKVTMFHLDEYVGLPETAPASFRRYLQERFLLRVPKLKAVYLVNGEAQAETECVRLNLLIKEYPIDVALAGIGENGHLAFNDPPADFETQKSFIVVELDNLCRQQQVNEGWFKSIAEVPKQAISMSIYQIMLSKNIVCSIPGARKAKAVKDSLEQEISKIYPASILQSHAACYCFLDELSSSMLTKVSVETVSAI